MLQGEIHYEMNNHENHEKALDTKKNKKQKENGKYRKEKGTRNNIYIYIYI